MRRALLSLFVIAVLVIPAPAILAKAENANGGNSSSSAGGNPPTSQGAEHRASASQGGSAASQGGGSTAPVPGGTYQGRSMSVPDQNGHGPERDTNGVDKPGGTGGLDDDRDYNNGCGNDTDFNDDNEGL